MSEEKENWLNEDREAREARIAAEQKDLEARAARVAAWEESDRLREEKLREAMEILRSRGIEMNIWACNCCEGAHVSMWVDGNLVVDDVDNFHPEMRKGGKS